ncbi:MAG TPA: hypothetical protein VHX39_29285, partial [Acetobacteraceae bacterium]|nr:hypothetical protein [Acetobacteraceae bacterium]
NSWVVAIAAQYRLLAGRVGAPQLVAEASGAVTIHDCLDPFARAWNANFHTAFAKMRDMCVTGLVLRYGRRCLSRR